MIANLICFTFEMVSSMRRFLPPALIAVILLVDGFVYGRWTNRWALSQELETSVARLKHVPMSFGDWEGQPTEVVGQREAEQAGFKGCLTRHYKNRRTGATVNILLACGRSGPLAVHTPDVCYRGAGFESLGTAEKLSQKGADGAVGEFWKGRFGKGDSTTQAQLRIYWSWTTTGTWQAPSNPRIHFGGAPALYKLYVIHPCIRDDATSERIGAEFLDQLLPQLDRCLFAKS